MLGKHYTHILLISEFDYNKFIRYITIGKRMPEWLDEYYMYMTKRTILNSIY